MTTEVIMVGRVMYPEVRGSTVYLTRHAVEAMVARQVTLSELHLILTDFEARFTSTHYRGAPNEDTYLYQRGNLAVVVHEVGKTIIIKTVLLRQTTQWSDADARARERN